MNATSSVQRALRLPFLPRDLLCPDAFLGLVPAQRVTLEETHISWVFLLENDVFKIKKPVSLGFLDFRTLAQRRAACEAEVALNRRLAPHVYRGLVPVRQQSDGRLALGGSGLLMEWAVHMARMPDHQRADHRLERNTLTPNVIDAIAPRIAIFHDASLPEQSPDAFAQLERNVQENFAQTADTLTTYLSPAESEEVVRWQRSFLAAQRDVFAQRVAAGRVRDGHGDLRLEHVYVDDDNHVTVLDCIEFNERFRVADVCADVAFFSMDLAARGRVDLAEMFLAAYAREANDFDLYQVVDFYESYRAFVRGKIAALVANDRSRNEAARRQAAREARRYFLLALSAKRQPVLAPSIVVVSGTIASGKSTIARSVGAALGAPVIAADRTRKAMLGVPPTASLPSALWQGAYTPEFTVDVYTELLRRANIVVRSGRSVVLDASFRTADMRRAARDLAGSHQVPFRLIECRVEPAVVQTRLAARERTPSISDGRREIAVDFAKSFEPIGELSPEEHIILHTERPLRDSLAQLRERLITLPAGFGS